MPKSLLQKLGVHRLLDSIHEMKHKNLDDVDIFDDFNEDDKYKHNTFEDDFDDFNGDSRARRTCPILNDTA